MACSCSPSSSTASPKRGFFTDHNQKGFSFSTMRRRPRSVLVASIAERTDSYNPLVFQAARLLGPPARFEASKLKVVHMGDEYSNGVIRRTYSLSHCDLTANLTLAVSNAISIDQLKGYYKNDDVVAEWKKVEEGICLVVHCHVSGPYVLPDLVAEFRYHIFTKELPLHPARYLKLCYMGIQSFSKSIQSWWRLWSGCISTPLRRNTTVSNVGDR